MTEAEAVAILTAVEIEGAAQDVRRLRQAARDDSQFSDFITRRAAREPVSLIIGRRAFWTHDFRVTPAVLDPRPDTETLVEAALAVPFTRVLDLGTGSGCILLSLLSERPEAQGLGVDCSEDALDVAQINRAELGLGARATLTQSDWFSAVNGPFDLIVSNPPYITEAAFATLAPEVKDHDPKIALTPGGDGLDAYRIICAEAPGYLTDGGALMVEIGFDQATAVEALFAQAGFSDIRIIRDINGKDRVIAAVLR